MLAITGIGNIIDKEGTSFHITLRYDAVLDSVYVIIDFDKEPEEANE